ncbi:response regulator [Ruegeria atlantica]|uniref:response regulator n=1 Tax=Ruegeria atlantica TaxID=81569 RepID=UPI00147DD95C|nr:response regulator [Ruegeria atlantica]
MNRSGDHPEPELNKKSQILAEIETLIADSLEQDGVLFEITRRLRGAFDFDECTLAVLSADGNTYQEGSLLDTQNPRPVLSQTHIPVSQGHAGKVIKSGQMQLLRGQAREQNTDGIASKTAAPTEPIMTMVLPMKAFGKVVGAITFSTNLASGYSREDIEIAQSVMTQCALIVDSGHLGQSSPRQALNRIIDAIDVIPEGFALYDADDRLVLANEMYRKMLYPGQENLVKPGMKFEQVVRKALSLNVIADAVGREEEWLTQRLERHKNPQGSQMQGRASGEWIKISERKTADNGIAAIYSDVTELKKVVARNAELAQIPEENPNPVMCISNDGKLIFANRACAQLLDALNLKVGAEVCEDWLVRVEKGLRENERQDFECHAGGMVYTFLLWPVPDAKHVNLYGRDVTQLKQAENRMRELARIPEENPNPVLRITSQGKLIYANRASAPLITALQLKVGDRVGTGWRKRVAKGLLEDQRQDFEYEAGGLIYALLLWPVPEGGYANIYGRDITTQKQVESELRVARDIAEAANKTKSTFLANMSHELRTPLNAIIGYSELMLEEATDQNDQANLSDLRKIQSAGKHLLALINDILDLSKIEAGKMEFNLESFDVFQMVKDVRTTVQPLADKNNNTLEIICPVDVGQMVCDLTKVRQALLNLLSNACKFTENATITLTVARSSTPDELEFSVADQGIGMSPEQVDKVFDAFTQADSSTTRHYGGTGLGLSITKVFCEQLGGSIQCTSTLGEGSNFIIRLPAVCQDPSVGWLKKADYSENDLHSDPNAPLVLLVDDDPTVHDLLGRRLRKEGYRILASTKGEDALALARATKPDAITLDVFMPEIDGWAVLSKLKEDPELSEIPVIMLTFAEDRTKGLSLGASEYLGKPIDTVELLNALKQHCPVVPAPRVLVVEDETATRELICRVLSKDGWQIEEAVNGMDALRCLSESVPDVILLDLLMPEMNGFEFLANMRKNTDWKEIPVIVVTAKTVSNEDRARLNGSIKTLIEKDGDQIETILRQLNEILPGSSPAADRDSDRE